MSYFLIVLIIIFSSLSLLHFYWAAGGQWWLSNALPTNENGQHVLKTGPVSSMVVGLGLLGFASYYFVLSANALSGTMTHIVGWIIPSIFLLRSIGDFKYVGFFKTVKSTEFARNDSRFYTPLCLILAVLGATVASQL